MDQCTFVEPHSRSQTFYFPEEKKKKSGSTCRASSHFARVLPGWGLWNALSFFIYATCFHPHSDARRLKKLLFLCEAAEKQVHIVECWVLKYIQEAGECIAQILSKHQILQNSSFFSSLLSSFIYCLDYLLVINTTRHNQAVMCALVRLKSKSIISKIHPSIMPKIWKETFWNWQCCT